MEQIHYHLALLGVALITLSIAMNLSIMLYVGMFLVLGAGVVGLLKMRNY